MINYTRTNLNKLIEVLNESGYIVRFEKGTFKSGYAIVKDRKIIIINKFYDIEARINTLLEIMDFVNIDSRMLTPKSKSFHKFLVKNKILIGLDLLKQEEE